MIFAGSVHIEAGRLSIELPRLGTIDWPAAALALIAVFRLKLGMAVVRAGSAGLGMALRVLGFA